MYNGIAHLVDMQCVVIENSPSGKAILLNRIKKLGALSVLGQVLFLLVNKLFAQASKGRIRELITSYGLLDSAIPERVIRRVDSINDEGTIELLRSLNPDAIVVNGTRIISNRVLSSIDAPFINTHMGITPKYRGVHGGYWALAKGDDGNCGVTVHLVDEGIDTGGVLYQDTIKTDKKDNFNTYPIHQIAKAIPLMISALDDVKARHIKIKQGVNPSQLWYHPTIVEYIQHWLRKGVK
jgi:methionyl-tRNA formyltransferase